METPRHTLPIRNTYLAALVFIGWAAIAPYDVYGGIGQLAPELTSSAWINSPPLSLGDLRGSVILVEFWTFGCYNCRNVEPKIKQWHETYTNRGLVIIGVHSPEFAYEKDVDAVSPYVRDHEIRYPVVTDNDFSIWNRYANHYWPAMYLIDKRGIIRYIRIGEGGYNETERMIQRLLEEATE